MLSAPVSIRCILEDYFTSSYLIDSDYQQLSVLWYNYGTKTGYLLHILTGNIFKELSAKVRKKSTHSAFMVLILNKGLIAFWGQTSFRAFFPHIVSDALTSFDCDGLLMAPQPTIISKRLSVFRKNKGTTSPQSSEQVAYSPVAKGSERWGTDGELLRPVGIGSGWCGVGTGGD